jgi:hypothetical protein
MSETPRCRETDRRSVSGQPGVSHCSSCLRSSGQRSCCRRDPRDDGAVGQGRAPTANGQPAFGCYLRSQPWGMMLLKITFFADPTLPGRFGLPERI